MALWIGCPLPAPAESRLFPLARQNDPAGWTVGAPTVESIYPAGMIFRLRAESSGGPIVRARLVWYRPVLRPGAIRRVQVEEARIDAGTGELVAVWQPDGLIMLPPWSVVAYHWELRDAAGSDFETGPQTAEYADHHPPCIRSESARSDRVRVGPARRSR